MQYWDTSTLLKLYVPESDSAQFVAHVGASFLHTSELARWEILRAIARKEKENAIPAMSAEGTFARFAADAGRGRIMLVPHDAAVEANFRRIVLRLHRKQPPVFIRTFDAIHLATADLLAATEVVTTDPRMRDGAVALGMKLFP